MRLARDTNTGEQVLVGDSLTLEDGRVCYAVFTAPSIDSLNLRVVNEADLVFEDGDSTEPPEEQALSISVSAASGREYRVASPLGPGSLLYTDREYTYTELPAEVVGLPYIMTANEDKGWNTPGFLQIGVNKDARLYVAYDSRAEDLPEWLLGWSFIGEVQTSDVMFHLHAADFEAGVIILGGNKYEGGDGSGSNYTVIIAER